MAGMRKFRDAYEFDPNTYGGEGGGLLDRPQAITQQNQKQGVDLGSTPNTALEYNPDNYGSPQGGLLGRLLSLQAEQGQYQPIPGNSEFGLSGPSDPNFRQLSRGPTVDRPQGAIASNPPDDRLRPAYSPLGADRAVQPDRSFSDRLQAWWDHPDPHGLVAVLQEAQRGVRQAVQGSIDATSTPSTEEEAFRQNQGRELGPIGAFKAASLQAPLSPARTSEGWRFLLDVLMSRAASTATAGINPLNPKPAAPFWRPTGDLDGNPSGYPMPQWPLP